MAKTTYRAGWWQHLSLGPVITILLRTNQTLTSLNLDANFIQAGSAVSILDAVKFNQSLIKLSLNNNSINLGAKDVSVTRCLGELFKENKTLRYLYLDNNRLSERFVWNFDVQLGKELKANLTLLELSLRGNGFSDADLKTIQSVLDESERIKKSALELELGMHAEKSLPYELKNILSNVLKATEIWKRM